MILCNRFRNINSDGWISWNREVRFLHCISSFNGSIIFVSQWLDERQREKQIKLVTVISINTRQEMLGEYLKELIFTKIIK